MRENRDSPAEILSEIATQKDLQTPHDVPASEHEAKHKMLQNQMLQQYLELQSSWSNKIAWLLIGSTAIMWLMIFLVGWNWLNFRDYPYLPHTIVGSFFIQVVGLGFVVARFLFSDGSQSPKKNL